MSTDERRVAPRAPIRLKVEYERAGAFCEDYSRNISAGGMFLVTKATVPAGARFELSFHVPGVEQSIVLNAVVVRVVGEGQARDEGTDPGVGLRFIFDSRDDRMRIAKFVRELESKENG